MDTNEEQTQEPKKKATKAAAPKTPRAKSATPRAKKTKDEAVETVDTKAEAPKDEVKAEATVPAVEAAIEPGASLRGLGRRKTAIARIRMTRGTGKIVVNRQPADTYFVTFEQRNSVASPMKTTGMENAVDVSVHVIGGGRHSQAEAVRLGISRALILMNPAYRKTLKKLGFLTRDPRAKERKKPGLKRARRAPQWSKR